MYLPELIYSDNVSPSKVSMSHPPRSPRTHFMTLWFCSLLRIHVSRSLSFLSALVCHVLPRHLFDGFC